MKKDVSSPSFEKIKIIKLGICAMPKKVNSKHMKNILDNFEKFEEFKIIIFTEDIIFKQEIENWPIVDSLIIFFSDGFPYTKALKYINLRKPFLVNDFEIQKVFWNREKVLRMLEEENIPIPSHIIIDRGDEINNEKENNSRDLNTSYEKEEKVKTYKMEINELIKNENKMNNVRKKMSVQNIEKEVIKMENEKKEKINKKLGMNNNITDNINIKNKNNSIEKSDENDELIEFDDHIEYKGKKLYKPFVEKPFNGDDHDIYIYYPTNLGGGQKRLFRKTKEYSSLYFPNLNKIRRDKSYIYEEFLPSDGFDVKIYTIGPDNTHAEARKSPTLDGKVNRSSDGKEIRYPINLTPKEKEIAKKIVLKFKQNICGFDILRCQGNSYVCDVNGFSFVKGNEQYYRDCTDFIRKLIKQRINYETNELNNNLSKESSENSSTTILQNVGLQNKEEKLISQKEVLRTIIAVFRHADRSPKEKMKLIIENEEFLSLFDEFGEKSNKNKKKEIKLKKPNELKRVLQIANNFLENNKDKKFSLGLDNFYTKIFQIKMVLEQKINFDGLTRKIQLKPLKFSEITDKDGNKINKITQALMILKWGGSLTHAGIEQARQLGNKFLSKLYPFYQNKLGGLLRLHSTYRHDLKCYSADEGRCLKTAASFLKGLLNLDGPIIPIISSMVRSDEDVNKILDDSESIQEFKGKIKEKLSECLNYDGEIKDKFYSLFSKESIFPLDDFKKENDIKIKEEDEKIEINDVFNEIQVNKNLQNEFNNINMDENNNEKEKEKECKIIENNQFNELLDKIGNPLKRLKHILHLMKNVIKNIQSFLPNEEDSSTYFITDKSQILKREYDNYHKKKLIEKILGEGINDIKNSTPMVRKLSEVEYFTSYNDNQEENSDKKDNKENDIYEKDTIDTLNETNFDCKDENIVLIYKRYAKLKSEFFNIKKNLFDISKIPDIYDNIKFDIIHNKDLMNNSSYELYDEISLLANFVMPFEYGITNDIKLKIGLKIIKPLLKKMYSDLIDINSSNLDKDNDNNVEKEDKNWSGLDQTKVNKNEIKEPERYVKSRLYFTCASHMYALLNIISYAYYSSSNKKYKQSYEKLKNIFDLDYCSHIIFRLFENLNVETSSPKRYRLEILMSPGSNEDPRKANKEHLIEVSPWIFLNKNLNLGQIKEVLNKFN